MKNILLVALLFANLVQAETPFINVCWADEVDPIPSSEAYDLLCAPQLFFGFNQDGSVRCRDFRFPSHYEAEGNHFHMLEGLAIMTLEIQKREPEFRGFPISIFTTDRQYKDCTGKGIIYHQEESNPNIGVCFAFVDQREAEINYDLGLDTYDQYWRKLQALLRAEATTSCDSAGLFRDGAHKGNLWKPVADPNARCRNGTTVLLDEKYNGIDSLDLLDKNCNKVASAQYFGLYDNSRPRFCFNFAGNKFGNDPVYLSFSSELKKVENASNRED